MLAVSLLAAALSAPAPAVPHTAPRPMTVVTTPRTGPAVTPANARRPHRRYFSDDDYPAAALRDRAEGRVGFALAIDANGRVNGCRITRSSGSGALDSATCRILRSRARYAPARDATGVAVPDADIGEIRWTLPAG